MPIFEKQNQVAVMDERYVFVVLSISGSPPSADELRKEQADYVFAPLGGNKIYTIDEEIWKVIGHHIESSYFPSEEEYNAILQKSLESHTTVLVGLVEHDQLDMPGRGETNLTLFSPGERYKAIDIGYDVIDSFGLSAISNVGYSIFEAQNIENLNISLTKFGLIDNKNDSDRFSVYADKYLEEHAPFSSIKIKLIRSD